MSMLLGTTTVWVGRSWEEPGWFVAVMDARAGGLPGRWQSPTMLPSRARAAHLTRVSGLPLRGG